MWLLLCEIIASLTLAVQKCCLSAAYIASRCQGNSLLGFGTALEYETRSYYRGRINEPQKTVTSGTIHLSLFVCSIWCITSFSFGACPEKSRFRVQSSHRSKNNLTAFDRGSDTCQLVLMYMSTCVLAQGWFGYRDIAY